LLQALPPAAAAAAAVPDTTAVPCSTSLCTNTAQAHALCMCVCVQTSAEKLRRETLRCTTGSRLCRASVSRMRTLHRLNTGEQMGRWGLVTRWDSLSRLASCPSHVWPLASHRVKRFFARRRRLRMPATTPCSISRGDQRQHASPLYSASQVTSAPGALFKRTALLKPSAVYRVLSKIGNGSGTESWSLSQMAMQKRISLHPWFDATRPQKNVPQRRDHRYTIFIHLYTISSRFFRAARCLVSAVRIRLV